MIGIGLRLWRHRDQAIALVRQAQELAAIIMGPASAQPQHAFDVKWVQQSLNVLRNAKLEPDGDYGEKTRAAIKKYQQDKGLEPDGWVGVVTLAALEQDMAERG
jgi:peptidoglycan hydrolase-like protein with peptidoglycan-binding domain